MSLLLWERSMRVLSEENNLHPLRQPAGLGAFGGRRYACGEGSGVAAFGVKEAAWALGSRSTDQIPSIREGGRWLSRT